MAQDRPCSTALGVSGLQYRPASAEAMHEGYHCPNPHLQMGNPGRRTPFPPILIWPRSRG